MENKKQIQLNNGRRTLIVSGIATSILSTSITTALPNVAEYFRISTSLGSGSPADIFLQWE